MPEIFVPLCIFRVDVASSGQFPNVVFKREAARQPLFRLNFFPNRPRGAEAIRDACEIRADFPCPNEGALFLLSKIAGEFQRYHHFIRNRQVSARVDIMFDELAVLGGKTDINGQPDCVKQVGLASVVLTDNAEHSGP